MVRGRVAVVALARLVLRGLAVGKDRGEAEGLAVLFAARGGEALLRMRGIDEAEEGSEEDIGWSWEWRRLHDELGSWLYVAVYVDPPRTQ